eukprot:scaffold6602_cov24-Tisochrysis_lutea.AAC.1
MQQRVWRASFHQLARRLGPACRSASASSSSSLCVLESAWASQETGALDETLASLPEHARKAAGALLAVAPAAPSVTWRVPGKPRASNRQWKWAMGGLLATAPAA